MATIPPASTTIPGVSTAQEEAASLVNSFRVTAVAERLATHIEPGGQAQSSEFFSLCLSLARGIDFAIANNQVPNKAQDLPALLKKICQRRNDLFLQAAIMVLMISVKNACKLNWFLEEETRQLLTLAKEVGSCFCSSGVINNRLNDSLSTICAVMSRFYPLMIMGKILASLEAKPGYEALVVDFNISKKTIHSPHEKIRLFVAQKDNIETSACIISPQQVNFLFNGKAVERRTNVHMDPGPLMPTNVTAMLKYGTNLLQAVGQFSGHYIIVVAFMSMKSSPDANALPDYVQSGGVAPESEDSDIIEGPSRISLKCPISRARIKTPVKGKACKHLQCFDFNNFVEINSRRPSWRCPHCNQHVCYPDIRVDQNMAKVLKEVADNVSDVIISADGSWKALFENDDKEEELHENILSCQKDGSEQPESAKAVPIVLDLTQDDDEADAMETETEDRKPPVANLQCQSATPITTPELMNAVGLNQNVVSNMGDNFWSGQGSGTYGTRTDAQVGGMSHSTPNFTVPPVFSDAISPAANQTDARGNANRTNLETPSEYLAANNLQLQAINSLPSHDYGRLQQIPRNISRTPIAIQALAAPSLTSTPQQRSRNSLNTLSTNGFSSISSDVERQQQLSRSLAYPHQSWNQQERLFAPSQSVQQVTNVAASSQLPGPHRAPSGLAFEQQNLQQRQALNPRLSQPRSPSPGLSRSSHLLWTQTQQGAAPVGLVQTTGNVNNNPSRFASATQTAPQAARQSPMVAVQTQTSRSVDGSRVLSGERLNVRGLAPAGSRADTSSNLASEQNWRPTGRMRGSLTGRNYSEALSQLIIQPTQAAQAVRPQTNLTSPPSVPPHLQALRTNSRNVPVPVPVSQSQNNAMTGASVPNGSSNILPASSSGLH